MTESDTKEAALRPPPGPWAAPRPDGPLADALRQAAVRLSAVGPPQPPAPRDHFVEATIFVPATNEPALAELAVGDEELAALAREAAERGERRDAAMLSLRSAHEDAGTRASGQSASGTSGISVARRMLLVAAIALTLAMALAAMILLVSKPDAPQAHPAQPADLPLKLDYDLGPAKSR